jgi:hypothetical protein
VTAAGPRSAAALAWTVAAMAAIVLCVSTSPAEARRASPFGEFRAALDNLFAPPRRARTVRAKNPRQAAPSGRQAASPGGQAALPSRSGAAKAEPNAKTEADSRGQESATRPGAPAKSDAGAKFEKPAAPPGAPTKPDASAKVEEPARRQAASSKPDASAKVEEPPAPPVASSPRPREVTEGAVPPDRAIPQPPGRPLEAPPRRERTTKSTPAKDATPAPVQDATPSPAKDATVEPRSREAAGHPQREQTAALPANKGAASEPEAAKDSAPPDQPQADQPPPPPPEPPPPSACQLRLPDLATIKILPPINNGACTAEEVVRLEAVTAKDGRRVTVAPPATLRCPMAESVVHWIRDEVTSVAADLGAPLKSVTVDTSFECRSRNHIAGAKLSEHGHANAVDLRAFTLANGVVVRLTDPAVQREARERLRETACTRFTTVLGPGSDSYHETHIHLDLAERRSGYRICQWDVRDPTVVVSVPLPPERPSSAPPRSAKGAKSTSRD